MNELIYTYSGQLTKLFELTAALTGVVLFSKYKNTNAKYFIYFLCYVFFLEFIGGYTVYIHKYEFFAEFKPLIKGTWFERNSWWYTIFWNIGSACFYSFYFRKTLKKKRFKTILKVLTYVFLVYSLYAIISDLEHFYRYTIPSMDLFSTIIIVLCILFYLFEVLNSDKILSFYRSLNIYISITVLLWTVITTPLAFFFKYFNVHDWGYVYLKTSIYFFSNFFMYGMFIFGLIVSKPENENLDAEPKKLSNYK